MATTGQNILKTLGYFDLFHYPLTREEISLFHAENIPRSGIDAGLEDLLASRCIFRIDEFYSLHNDLSLAERRKKGNSMAAQQMRTAHRVAKLLSKFPYTKGIAVSGSLSKNFATDKTDIDFFIITEANRLWIARTFMHLYKKFTYLTGRQHWFCMNYYVDEAELEISEKNIFTAMEIATLIPMQGKVSLDDFMAGNDWIKEYFPVNRASNTYVPEIRKSFACRIIERIFRGDFGNTVDMWLMGITDRRWKKKTEKHEVNRKGAMLAMSVGRHFSKPDPRNFQHKIIEQYVVKVQQLLQMHDKRMSLAQ